MQSHIVFITAGSAEEAERIAHALVEERLAACVNIVPGVTSVYRWEGQVQRDAEVLLVAKTLEANVARLAQRVKELHSYDVPEVVALPITDGSPEYLAWLADSVE
jgi:periplasmic divalent cation tolerance protein